MSRFACLFRQLRPIALLAAACFAVPANADVDVRVTARPVSSPIQSFITVTDGAGAPVAGLAAGDFTVTVDGVAVPVGGITFSLPPSQDPSQKVSVVFALDYSPSVKDNFLDAMRNAVIAFIDAMEVGDYAAVIKFTGTSGAQVIQPFTQIDAAGGPNRLALTNAVMANYGGRETNLLDAINLAIDQFDVPLVPLPNGPKAVIVITDGVDNASTSLEGSVINNASDSSIPLFAVGVGNVTAGGLQLLTNLSTQTGGVYLPAPDDAEIAAAYATLSALLDHEYLLTFSSPIGDCEPHTLAVTVSGETGTLAFQRCDDLPDAFSFANETGVARNAVVTSNIEVITGIDVPVAISVTGGEYSIGCDANFTSAPGTINFAETVCVRHTASAQYNQTQETNLTVGGVTDSFMSRTTQAPASSGGGGGAAGVVELLLGLGLLFARRHG